MKIVLLVDIKGLGARGDTCEVGDGYAMNLLIPQGKAVDFSDARAKTEIIRKKEIEERLDTQLQNEKEAFAALPDSLQLSCESNDEDGLFTAIKPETIEIELNKQGIPAKKSWFQFTPIKQLGEHTIDASLEEEQKKIVLTIVKA